MTDIERYEPQSPTGGNPAHVRLSINDAWRVSKAISAGGLFQSNRRNMTPEEVYTIVMAGQSLGIGPVPAMMSFHLVEGRAEMSANLQAFFVKASGRYDYRITEHTNDACEITLISVPTGEVVGVERYTMEDAERAELTKLTQRGQKTQWHKGPRNMLFARCISNLVAFHCPDVVPMRVYGTGEISGYDEDTGVQAVEGEGGVPVSKVEALVNQALQGDEEVIEDAEVIDDPPEMAEADRFSPVAVETRLRSDLPKLNTDDKELIKFTVSAEGLAWGYASIVKLIIDAGYSDVFSWLRHLAAEINAGAPVAAAPAPSAPVEAELPVGVSGRSTGSQTAPTVSDSQVKMLHARFGDCGFSEDEKRYFLSRYANSESTRDVHKADVDDLLVVLRDIQNGDDDTRRAYLGGD